MTNEERELLLKDLCARLPYGVKVQVYYEDIAGSGYFYDTVWSIDNDEPFHVNDRRIENIKPYLRSMSSMTFGEWEEMTALIYQHGRVNRNPDNKNELLLWLSAEGNDMPIILMDNVFSWLNSHHFDYRGLIEKGLAIEVTEENNPYK